MLCIDLSYYLLMRTLIQFNPNLNTLPRFKVYHFKLHLNLLINILAICRSCVVPISIDYHQHVGVIWVIPDKSIKEKEAVTKKPQLLSLKRLNNL